MYFQASQSWGFSSYRLDGYLVQVQTKEIAKSRGWLRLGHYRKNIFGQWKSSLRGGFFLATDGHTNPEAELQATVRAFFKDGPEDTHAQCRYLGRREWLKKNISIHPDDLLPCKEEQEWKKKLDATGVSLIFASADTSSASSIYGHTFIKIISRNQEYDRDLLNYGVNYAARATDSEGVLYALKGLFGYYKGGFTMLPYHEKLREYVNVEGRDIWEYRLNLTPMQVDQLLNHLLELGDSWSPYYFARDNCSFQLLSLLEASNEDLDLVRHFNNIVIPLDTIKIISRIPGLVVEKKIRKSLKKDFTENYARLNNDQKKIIKKTIDSGVLPSANELSKNEQSDVLETTMKLYALKSYQDEKSYEEQKYKLMIARAQLGTGSDTKMETSTSQGRSPDQSHDSAGVYLGGGRMGDLNFLSFKLRTAFHDMVSPDEALFEFSHNEVLSADIRYYTESSRLDLQRFTLFNLLTSLPVTELEQPISWKIQIYSEPELYPHVHVGFGYSFDLPKLIKTRFIGLVSAQLDDKRIGMGPDLFLVHKLKDWLTLMVNYRGSWNDKNYQKIWNTQVGIPINQQWELRLEHTRTEDIKNEWQVRVLKQFIL